MRSKALVLTAFGAVLVVACGGSTAPTGRPAGYPASLASISLEQVYAQAQRSLLAGGIYHEKLETTTELLGRSDVSHEERWTDAAGDRVREKREVWNDTERAHIVILIVEGEVWSPGPQTQPASSCNGAKVATSTVLGCIGDDAQGATSVRSTKVDGKRRIALITSTHRSQGEDATLQATETLYLDPDSMLPTAQQVEGTWDDGKKHRYRSRTTITGSFVRAATLPAGFFDPATQSWKRPDPVASFPPQALIYWLGPTWKPAGGLPAVRLAEVVPNPGDGQEAMFFYGPAADRYAPPVLSMQVTRRANWNSRTAIAAAPCTGTPPVQVLDGSARLFCRGREAVIALVTLSDAVVLLDAGKSSNGTVTTVSPFATVPAMRQVLAALHKK